MSKSEEESRGSLSLSEKRFIEICVDAANEYNKQEKSAENKIQWDISGLQECYQRAAVTSELFKMEDGINYYREAGQYCYWIRKLKPFFLSGHNSPLINEYISFFTAAQVIYLAQMKIFNEMEEKGRDFEKCSDEAKANYERVYRLENKVANSLRYYVHSSGSIPMLLEALFSISADPDFA